MNIITPSSFQLSLMCKMLQKFRLRAIAYVQNCKRRQYPSNNSTSCLVTAQHCRYASSSSPFSENCTNMEYQEEPRILPSDDDDLYVKLLEDDNRQRFLKCIQNSKSKSQEDAGRRSKQKAKLASVLIAICTDEKGRNPSLLYTRRSRQLRRHKLQISFPGGNNEIGEDPVDCALRETTEEIGLQPDRVIVWGKGRHLKTIPSVASPVAAIIIPVVGVIKNFKITELTINESEVEEAFSVPIKHLNNRNNCSYTQFRNGYTSPVFHLDKQLKIWGITGFLTRMFLNCFLPSDRNQIRSRYKYISPHPSTLNILPP